MRLTRPKISAIACGALVLTLSFPLGSAGHGQQASSDAHFVYAVGGEVSGEDTLQQLEDAVFELIGDNPDEPDGSGQIPQAGSVVCLPSANDDFWEELPVTDTVWDDIVGLSENSSWAKIVDADFQTSGTPYDGMGLGGVCHMPLSEDMDSVELDVRDDVFGSDVTFWFRCTNEEYLEPSDGSLGGWQLVKSNSVHFDRPPDCWHVDAIIEGGATTGTIDLRSGGSSSGTWGGYEEGRCYKTSELFETKYSTLVVSLLDVCNYRQVLPLFWEELEPGLILQVGTPLPNGDCIYAYEFDLIIRSPVDVIANSLGDREYAERGATIKTSFDQTEECVQEVVEVFGDEVSDYEFDKESTTSSDSSCRELELNLEHTYYGADDQYRYGLFQEGDIIDTCSGTGSDRYEVPNNLEPFCNKALANWIIKECRPKIDIEVCCGPDAAILGAVAKFVMPPCFAAHWVCSFFLSNSIVNLALTIDEVDDEVDCTHRVGGSMYGSGSVYETVRCGLFWYI